MSDRPVTITTRSPAETADLARRLGRHLGPGDAVMLEGGIGAGKTHFARHLILSLLPRPEEVPSPTYTLVQTYDSPAGEIWHADLYRLGAADELVELGLDEAFESAICLVEWPDRLGPLRPPGALWMSFSADPAAPQTRHIRLRPGGPRWEPVAAALTEAAADD